MKIFLLIITLLSIFQYASLQECQSKLDSSSDMKGTCSDLDSCTGAVIGSDCSNGLVCCVKDEAPESRTGNSLLTKDIFLKIVGDTPRNNELYYYLTESFDFADIKNEFQIAAYVSQLMGETQNFKKIESTQIEKDFNSAIGNNNTGDGTKFRGRGGILLRGKNNYLFANNKLMSTRSARGNNLIRFNIFNEPEKTAFPSIAFKVAAWFWKENAYVIKSTDPAGKSSLNELADGTFLSFAQLTHSLTNKIKSLKERANLNEQILAQFQSVSMKRGRGVTCEIKSETELGYAVPICLIDFKKPYCGCEGKIERRTCAYGRLKSGACRNSLMIKCCYEKCHTNLDLVILMDKSGSVTEEGFEKEKNFVKELINQLDIGINATRLSIVDFDNEVTKHMDFNDVQTNEAALDVLSKIELYGGGTQTGKALAVANDFILQEHNGMRPIKSGIPKVVLTITDGQSSAAAVTVAQAKRLKKREINMVSVGVADANLNELLDLSSTPNDQYYVEDFDKILDIIKEITVTTCQQPARVEQEEPISSKVEKDTYKYFKYSVPVEDSVFKSTDRSFKNNFTIVMEEKSGSSDLYYSFEEKNPKSDEDYVKDEDPADELEENFIDDVAFKRSRRHLLKRNVNLDQYAKTDLAKNKKYYSIDNPKGLGTLYFSVIGKEEENSIEVQVLNRTVVPPYNTTIKPTTTTTKPSTTTKAKTTTIKAKTTTIKAKTTTIKAKTTTTSSAPNFQSSIYNLISLSFLAILLW